MLAIEERFLQDGLRSILGITVVGNPRMDVTNLLSRILSILLAPKGPWDLPNPRPPFFLRTVLQCEPSPPPLGSVKVSN
jgi:hypothetical protein